MQASDLEAGWREFLEVEFKQPYMQSLKKFLADAKKSRVNIFPEDKNIFNAFNLTPFNKVKVVILGQDPYHGEGQAHGLSFSVPVSVKLPPSLVNIFRELESDLGIIRPAHGCLSSWAAQGVLLLNSILTVEESRPGSHENRGWETFTDRVVHMLNEHREGLVFMLWGSYAQKKALSVDSRRHLVLKAPHPSPLSAYRGFLGCRHFSQANNYLKKHGLEPIDWQLPE